MRIVLSYRSSSKAKGPSQIKSNAEELLPVLPDKIWDNHIWGVLRLNIICCFSEIYLGILYFYLLNLTALAAVNHLVWHLRECTSQISNYRESH